MGRNVVGSRKQVSRDNRGLDRFRERVCHGKMSVPLLSVATGKWKIRVSGSLVSNGKGAPGSC